MDLRPTCSTCGCAMDMSSIRADGNGGFICRTCLEAKEGGLRKPLTNHNTRANNIFSKKSYFCGDCGYSFERNATFIVKNCPMCAKSNCHEVMIEDHEVTVDHEADEIIFQ